MPRLPSDGGSTRPQAACRVCPGRDRPPSSAPPTSICRNFHPPAATDDILPRFSLHTSVGMPSVGLKSPLDPEFPSGDALRHATCLDDQALEKGSQSSTGSVNSGRRSAKKAHALRRPFSSRCIDEAERSVRRCGWNHGATGPGYRKRTRVRVACGVTIRPCGVGILSSHGHFGRSVEGSVLSPVVLEPAGEASLRGRHLSRGPGLPAAALTASFIGPPRMSALADSSLSATRRRRAVVNRAASLPDTPARVPGGWTRRTRPDPRTRLPQV
jgi:hypothetical protein